MIYHYTTLNALVSMLTSDKENAILRLTRLDYLNDSDEYYDYDRIINSILFDITSAKMDDDVRLRFNQLLNSVDLESKNTRIKNIFTMSFSLDCDSIPMWNYYSNNTGIALGFRKSDMIEKIEKSLSPNIQDFSPREVEINTFKMVYEDENKRSLLRKQVNDFIINERKHHSLFTELNISLIYKMGKQFKNSKFKYENEYRICLDFTNIDALNITKFHATGMNIKPFVELKINKNDFISSIYKIIVSPLNTSNMIENGLRELLESNGHTLELLEIKKSECTLRSL